MYEKDANTRAEIIAKHGSHNERVKKAIRMTRNLVDGKNMLPARARDRAARYFGVAPRDIPARM